MKFRPSLPKEDVDALAKADFLKTLPRNIKIHLKAIKREIKNNGTTITATRSTSQEEKQDEVIRLLRAVNFKVASQPTVKNKPYRREPNTWQECAGARKDRVIKEDRRLTPFKNRSHLKAPYEDLIDTGANKTLMNSRIDRNF
ncbi:hypothetical protein RF11_05600 [Thelohanellus kitauei]|uniref:Uncharacterized protein n=1 Tax=Thelohanellus kitauei TaxID=669202 RepID=A0A0C2MFN7_THEKT|nr:hypothetical protein RF11_05600 [Thelohanellus kitauei]